MRFQQQNTNQGTNRDGPYYMVYTQHTHVKRKASRDIGCVKHADGS